MTSQVYFGFSNANSGEQSAWFHTEAAARRFAAACGWENAEIETITTPDAGDVMDTAETPWKIV